MTPPPCRTSQSNFAVPVATSLEATVASCLYVGIAVGRSIVPPRLTYAASGTRESRYSLDVLDVTGDRLEGIA